MKARPSTNAATNNRANQLNPNNSAFRTSRGLPVEGQAPEPNVGAVPSTSALPATAPTTETSGK